MIVHCLYDCALFISYKNQSNNMMLAWPGSEREATDDFFFVLTR